MSLVEARGVVDTLEKDGLLRRNARRKLSLGHLHRAMTTTLAVVVPRGHSLVYIESGRVRSAARAGCS